MWPSRESGLYPTLPEPVTGTRFFGQFSSKVYSEPVSRALASWQRSPATSASTFSGSAASCALMQRCLTTGPPPGFCCSGLSRLNSQLPGSMPARALPATRRQHSARCFSMGLSSARTEPASLERGAHRKAALVVGEVEIAVQRVGRVAHAAMALHGQRTAAGDVEAEGAAVVV